MKLPVRRLRISLAFSIAAVIVSIFSPELVVSADALPQARIVAVNDGDTVTLIVNGKKQRCRLIGIDAPETGQEPWGMRAKGHLRTMLKEQHWQVTVETGLQQADKYNRLLVYLWTSDGMLINEQMLLDGYAVLFTIQPNSKYADRFTKAQKTARDRKRAIWSRDGLKETPLKYKMQHPRQ